MSAKIHAPIERKLAELWYRAYNSPYGIRVSGSNPRILRTRFNQVRRKLEDERLSNLSIRTSPDNPQNQVWIVHGGDGRANPAAPNPNLETL